MKYNPGPLTLAHLQDIDPLGVVRPHVLQLLQGRLLLLNRFLVQLLRLKLRKELIHGLGEWVGVMRGIASGEGEGCTVV
jgi:hypothetical protein